jgi:hypothetical protein
MSSVTLYRASGLALLLGPVLFIIGGILAIVFTPVTPLGLVMIGVGTSGLVLLLLGLPSIVARQASRAGWLGFVGFLLTFSGAFLFASSFVVVYLVINPWLNVHAPNVRDQLLFTANSAVNVYGSVATGLFVVGLVLLGSATMRARVFPQWAGLLFIVGVVVSGVSFLISIFGSGALVLNVASGIGLVALVLVLLGFGWIGYALLTAKGEAVPQPALTS